VLDPDKIQHRQRKRLLHHIHHQDSMPPHPAAFPSQGRLAAGADSSSARSGRTTSPSTTGSRDLPPPDDRCSKEPRGRLRNSGPLHRVRGAARAGSLTVAGKQVAVTSTGSADASRSGQGPECDPGRPGGPRWPGRGLWRRWSRPPVGCVAVWPWLPDTHPSCGLEPQLVSGADIKRAVELVEVPRPVILQEPGEAPSRNVRLVTNDGPERPTAAPESVGLPDWVTEPP
jgi:hypothetical protein